MLPLWRQELERRELLEPFKLLIGENFVGRVRELKLLRDYVDIVPPSGVFEGWSRWAKKQLFGESNKPFVIHGVGGIGKSALMAEFILEHAAVTGERAFPFVYLDFDRASIDPGNALSLLSDCARQLASQFPDVSNALRLLDVEIQQRSAETRIERNSHWLIKASINDASLIARLSAQFVDVLKRGGLDNRPFLLVLDTFEEVQAKGDDAVDAVFAWIDAIARMPSLKVVISGRAPIEDRPQYNSLLLTPLSKSAGREFLEKHGVRGVLTTDILSQVGGNPLSLRLALWLARSNDALTKSWADADREFFRQKLTDLQIQGYLYSRLLERIGNERIRPLVDPGLILRRVTPELIKEVLAPAAKLGDITSDEATELFAGLRKEVSLVSVDGESLVHRKDVRAVMLTLQRQKDAVLFGEINTRAAVYYKGRNTIQDQIEFAYHSLMLGANAIAVLTGMHVEVVRGLGSSITELPADAALTIRVLLSQSLSKAEARQLPDDLWEVYAFQRATRLVYEGSPDAALDLAAERESLWESQLLSYPRALGFFHVLEWQSSDAALAMASDYSGEYFSRLPIEILQRQDLKVLPLVERGYLAWYRQMDRESAAYFYQAYCRAKNMSKPIVYIETLIGLLLVSDSGADPGVSHSELRKEFGYAVSQIAIAEWKDNLSILRRLVFLGFADTKIATLAIGLFGLRLRSRKRILAFAEGVGGRVDSEALNNLLSYAVDDYPSNIDSTLGRSNELAKLERKIAGMLASGRRDHALFALPFLRGRFAAWHIPIRTSILLCVDDRKKLAQLLGGIASEEVNRIIGDEAITSFRTLVEQVIGAADASDTIMEVARACADASRDSNKNKRVIDLLSALERYSDRLNGISDTDTQESA